MGHITNAAAIAATNAVVDLLDVGGAGSIVLYGGAVPADADATASATVIASGALPNPAFGGASDSTGDATANANSISALTASAAGTITHFRCLNNAGTAVWQGTVGTSSADLVISSVTVALSETITITDLEFRSPEAVTAYVPTP